MAAHDDMLTTVMNQMDIEVNEDSSPSPATNSGTRHDKESLNDEQKLPNIDSLSATTFSFDQLEIYDEYDHLCPQEYADHSTGPFNNNVKRDYTPVPAYGHRMQQCSHKDSHFNPGHASARGGGMHLNARSWVSGETRAAQEFLSIRNAMRRMFKNADIAKWKVADYFAHREAVMASKAKQLAQQAQECEAELMFRVPPIPLQKQDMMRRCGLSGNFEKVGNYSRALGKKTIWCEDWQNGKDEIAPWPCLAELRWEGDNRAKTGVGRYPPLPREQGPVGLPWNQLQAVEQFPLDQIARIPTMEDVYLPIDEVDDEVKYDLLNKDLEDAMDAYLKS